MPVLWHIMKGYAHYGYRDFVLLLGYKGDQIRRYFTEYGYMARDFTLKTGNGEREYFGDLEDWTITFADTWEDSLTERRLALARKHLEGGDFMLTYGDGVGDVDLKALKRAHSGNGKRGTITVYNPESKYGIVNVDGAGNVLSFREKPLMTEFVNIGFMAFRPDVFDSISKGNVMMEDSLLPALAKEGDLGYHHHKGFWKPMDTYKDFTELNGMWAKGDRRWKVWE